MKIKKLVAVLIVLAPVGTALADPGGASANGINHTVKRGETLFSIAETYYGNGYEWVKLKEYNPWVEDDKLNVGEIIHVPEPKQMPGVAAAAGGGQTSFNLAGPRVLFSWIPKFSGVSLFGRNLFQVILFLMAWFLVHCTLQGFIIWFAAHLTFVKDVSMKKAMRATLQAESLAFLCFFMFFFMGLMLLYVSTTSPGKPVGPEILGAAEQYMTSPTGMVLCGLIVVGLYVFLGIRFIPPVFGIETGRAVALVVIGILLPHFIGLFLVGHRMGLIQ